MKSKKIVTLLLIIFLDACSGQAATFVPLATKPVMNTPTEMVQSSTLPPLPTVLSTETIPVATSNAIATLDTVRVDLENRFPELLKYRSSCDLFSCYGIQTSPDEKWIYFTNNNTIDLFRKGGQKVGNYSFHEIYGYLINYSGGYIFPVHWAEDGRYLYVTANIGGDGGPEAYFHYDSALVRVDLENGMWQDMNISGSLKFSPDGKFIVYSDSKGRIRIRDLQTDEEQAYFAPEKYVYFGDYVWSLDNKKVVFVATPESWELDDSRFALLMVDIENQVLLDLYTSSFPFYYPVGWLEGDKVILSKFQEFGEWELNLSKFPLTSGPMPK